MELEIVILDNSLDSNQLISVTMLMVEVSIGCPGKLFQAHITQKKEMQVNIARQDDIQR